MAALHGNTRTKEFQFDKFRGNKSSRDRWNNNKVVKKAGLLGIKPREIFIICFDRQIGLAEFAKYESDVSSFNRTATIPEEVKEFCSKKTICSYKRCRKVIDGIGKTFIREVNGIISMYCSPKCMDY